MQEFIENQVYSTSQDALYSLGLSLSKVEDATLKQDSELMINAIFDSGYYEYIEFIATDTTPIYKVSLPVVVKDVPSWFITLVPLHLQEARGEVNDGWKIRGELHVKGHAGYAYYELYKSFKKLIVTFLIISVVAFSILIFIINTLLYSLTKIREQANGINEHKFIIEKDGTFVSEFDLLIKAMNRMVHKVEGIFKSEVETFEQYQNILYKDEETLLPNKKYFMLKLQEILDDESRNIGYIAIISIGGLKKIKEEEGYLRYKESLWRFIETIPEALREENLLARISEHEIAVLFSTHNIKKIEEYFSTLQDALSISTTKQIKTEEKLLCFSIGVAPYFENDKLSEALSRVDYSLSRSKINGCNIIDIYDAKERKNELVTLGKNSWKEKFEKIFDEDRVRVVMQSVKEREEVYHKEALLRVREDDGSLQTAGYYLPMANALGLVARFDKSVIDNVIGRVESFKEPVALNISREFILQSVYFLELRSTLAKLRVTYPAKLHFESPESEILQDLDTYIEFSDMVHAHNQKFGIDRFSGINNLSYIENLRPDYIKINVNFVLESLESNQAILKTLDILSQTMGIELIITAVQESDQLQKLKEVGYSKFQGRYVADIEVN
jgi:diguanylate cyclase (GGDEF)-like protein